MKRMNLSVCAFLLIILSLTFIPMAQAQVANFGELKGTVVSLSHHPVAGATIILKPTN